ncbi:MAG: MbcA/ParS/Xre antitoxin family protein [Acidobacteria bacterium]|nr:MbcA/ParS/Xre antitoxin family protein [Acidobacteriota bacterium]
MPNPALDPIEIRIENIRREAEEVVLDPDRWLRTPHDLLGGREPIDLIRLGDEGEQIVRDLLESIKHGMFT